MSQRTNISQIRQIFLHGIFFVHSYLKWYDVMMYTPQDCVYMHIHGKSHCNHSAHKSHTSVGDLNTDELDLNLQNVHLNPNFVHSPSFQQIKFWACNTQNIKLLRILQERWREALELSLFLHITEIAFAWYTRIPLLQNKISRFVPVYNFFLVTFFPPRKGLLLTLEKIFYHLLKYLKRYFNIQRNNIRSWTVFFRRLTNHVLKAPDSSCSFLLLSLFTSTVIFSP